MQTTFGEMPTSLPAGYFCAVRWPVLAMLDTKTGDGRLLASAGGGTRDLPLSTSAQFTKSFGHDGAVLSGAIFQVTMDPDNNTMSGRGFLLDDEFGRRHALAIKTQSMAGNSVGLADIKARFVEDLDTGEYWIEFTEWNLADTTGVMTPAFAEARTEIDNEIAAAFGVDFDPMVELVASSEIVEYRIPNPEKPLTPEVALDLVASFGAPQPYDSFFRPEATKPQKVIFTADGDVYGHLATWESCHEGVEGRCVRVPRPPDGYASWNKPGVLTEKGIVATGPIALYGGHKYGDDLSAAYGRRENAWCDVRITEGKFGPWISGRAIPHLADDKAYDARASRISGHWKDGLLRGIVSVNSEGFDVPGGDVITASFEMGADGEITDLIAGFPGCLADEPPVEEVALTVDTAEVVRLVLANLREAGVIPADAAPPSGLSVLAELIAQDLEDDVD